MPALSPFAPVKKKKKNKEEAQERGGGRKWSSAGGGGSLLIGKSLRWRTRSERGGDVETASETGEERCMKVKMRSSAEGALLQGDGGNGAEPGERTSSCLQQKRGSSDVPVLR